MFIGSGESDSRESYPGFPRRASAKKRTAVLRACKLPSYTRRALTGTQKYRAKREVIQKRVVRSPDQLGQLFDHYCESSEARDTLPRNVVFRGNIKVIIVPGFILCDIHDIRGASRDFTFFFSSRYYTAIKYSWLFALQFGVFVRAVARVLIQAGCFKCFNKIHVCGTPCATPAIDSTE